MMNNIARFFEILFCIFSISIFILYMKLIKLRKKKSHYENEHAKLKEKFDMEIERMLKLQEDIKDLTEKYEYVLESISNLDFRAEIEEFMEKVLKIALKVVPGADWGSVVVIENGKGRYKAAVGFDLDTLKTVELSEEGMYKSKDIVIVDKIVKLDEKILGKETTEKLKKAGKGMEVYKTLVGNFWFHETFLGGMYLDALKPVNFSKDSIKIFGFLVNVSNIYILLKKFYELEKMYHYEIVDSILNLMNLRIPHAEYHAKNTAVLAIKIGKKMGIDEGELDTLFWACILHDIGKIGIPDEILNKPTTLTKTEYDLVQTHVVLGEEMLVSSDYLKKLANVIRHQCERWDGKGYPDGLKGEEIPLLSRILHVACSYNAMRMEKPFKKALTFEEAMEELRTNIGRQFDPYVVETTLEILENEDERWIVPKETDLISLRENILRM